MRCDTGYRPPIRERGHAVEGGLWVRPSSWEALSDPKSWKCASGDTGPIVTKQLADYRLLQSEGVVPGGPGHDGMVLCEGYGPLKQIRDCVALKDNTWPNPRGGRRGPCQWRGVACRLAASAGSLKLASDRDVRPGQPTAHNC